MTRRFRWERPLAEASVMVTRIADDHDLADRADGRFLAYYLAQVARTTGVHDAKQQAVRRAAATEHPDVETATTTAERFDYWDRGAAWRTAVLSSAEESVSTFAYVLANALYWTGEVGRTDSRADELCYRGAAAAGATIDLGRVVGHADYERHRAAAHRHRRAQNHALAPSPVVIPLPSEALSGRSFRAGRFPRNRVCRPTSR